MDVRFEIENIVTPALLREFAGSRAAGKQGLDRAINDAMRYLLSFAWPKIEAADPKTMERYFLFPAATRQPHLNRGRVAKGAMAAKWRGTVAAAIVAAAVKQSKGRSKKLQGLVTQARGVMVEAMGATKAGDKTQKARAAAASNVFYQRLNAFVKGSQRSRGYHRSGLIPAMKEFRVGRVGGLGGGAVVRNPPGSGKRALAAESSPEAIMVNTARAIAEVWPHVFEQAAKEVRAKLIEYTGRNLAERMKRAGFEVR